MAGVRVSGFRGRISGLGVRVTGVRVRISGLKGVNGRCEV